MKHSMKRKLVTTLAVSFVVALSAGAIANERVNASAESSTVGNFYMQDGAGIRVSGSGENVTPSGIRWATNVTESFYNAVTENGTKEVEFGTLVDNAAIVDVATNTTEVVIPCTSKPSFNADDGVEETWTYYASITYDKLAQELKDDGNSEEEIKEALTKAYETELYARAYIKIGETYSYYAENGDTCRSIKGVAMHCLLEESEEVTPTTKTSFETYAGGSYSVAKTETFGDENAYSLTKKTGTVTSVDEMKAGKYSVYIGAKKITDVTLSEDGKISATVAGLGAMKYEAGKTYNARFINEDNEVYQVPFFVATHTISTAAEFIDYMNGWSGGASAETNGTSDDYVVLTDDISLNADYYKTTADYFAGTFNGLGHTISNATVKATTNHGGLMGRYDKAGVLENVAFVNITSNWAYNSIISGYFSGTLKNVYAQTEFTVTSSNGAFSLNAAKAENCIVNISHKGANGCAFGVYSNPTLDNCYAIGNAAYLLAGTEGVVYANGYTFVNENKAKVSAWDDYWSLKGDTFYFGDTVIAVGGSVNDTLYTAVSTFDLTTLTDGEEIVSFSVNGTATTVPANGAYDLTGFTYGEVNELNVVLANGTAITQPIVTASHVISSAEEFMAYMNSWSGGSTATTNGTSDDYVVLTKDINLGGENVALKRQADYFAGKFNGLGHTVTNMKYQPKDVTPEGAPQKVYTIAGIFGRVNKAGVIENVAFTGITSSDGGNSALISDYMCGTVKNVYVQASVNSLKYVVRLAWGNNTWGTFSNSIVNINYTSTSGTLFDIDSSTKSNLSAVKNTYAFGNATAFSAWTEDTRTVYADVATFLTAEKANITSANGWSEYWNFSEDGNTLYFGELLIGKLSVNVEPMANYLLYNGASEYQIVLAAEAHTYETLAANELQSLFEEATGVQFRIVSDSEVTEGDKFISIGETQFAKKKI